MHMQTMDPVKEVKMLKSKVISVTEEEKTINAPALYDLTSLQRDANRIFGYTAKQTLDYGKMPEVRMRSY